MIGKRDPAFPDAADRVESEAGEDAPPSLLALRARLVLEVAPGERRLLPEFGCRIHQLPSLDGAALCELAAALVEEALDRWAPDLGVDRADVLAAEGKEVRLRLRASGAWHALTITHRRAAAAWEGPGA